MSAKSLLLSLFHFKASIDRELLAALSMHDIAPERLRPALRVLHHALTVDRIFAANLQRQAHPFRASWEEHAPALPGLTAAMQDIDRWYVAYVSTVTPEELEEMIDFTFTDGERGRMSREEMLAHVVTHSGYHRGEVGRLIPDIEATAMRDVFAGFLHRSEPERRS